MSGGVIVRLLSFGLLIFAAFLWSAESIASRVLFIGNSYTGFSKSALQEFEAANPNHEDEFGFQFVGGTNLEAHTTREETLRALQCNRYDYVVLQDHSLRVFVDANSFRYGIKTLADLARASGAEPVLFETWARGRQGSFHNYVSDQTAVSNSYHQAGEDFGIHVMHVGDVWLSVFQSNRPLFNELYQDDAIHQARPGTYVVAASTYSVFNRPQLSSAPSLSLSAHSRSIFRGFSQNLNSEVAPHTNPYTRPVCDTVRDSLIRQRCGCTGTHISTKLAPIIDTLLD